MLILAEFDIIVRICVILRPSYLCVHAFPNDSD